jgi:hypothetical protein
MAAKCVMPPRATNTCEKVLLLLTDLQAVVPWPGEVEEEH